MKVIIAEYDNGEFYERVHDVIAASLTYEGAKKAVLTTEYKDMPIFTEMECKSDEFNSTLLYYSHVLLYEMEVS